MPDYVVVDKNGNVVDENSEEAMRRVPKNELKAYQAARGIKNQPQAASQPETVEAESEEKAAEESENKAVEKPTENKSRRAPKE